MPNTEIVQIGSNDLVGQRFNGQDVTIYLNQNGIGCHHLVWEKMGANADTSIIFPWPGRRTLAMIIEKIESFLNIRCLLQFWTFSLLFNRFYRRAKVVHLHLIQWPSYFSILILPFISRMKRTVWTIHDCWAFTGHCVYPFDCERWKVGCGQCKYKKTTFSISRDTTKFMWKVKSFLYSLSPFEIVVASKFMYDMVSISPIFKNKKIHLVPFGLDLNVFKPDSSQSQKKYFGIDDDTITIGFRCAMGEFKGLDNIKAALHALKTDRKICLLSFNDLGRMEEFRDRFQIIDLQWVSDPALTAAAYQAMDFFLMPSIQEAFGVMAIEAMACGKPVVVFSGTSLPEVIGGDQCGTIVPAGDNQALSRAIKEMVENDNLRREKGLRARAFAEANYDSNVHMQRLLDIYKNCYISTEGA